MLNLLRWGIAFKGSGIKKVLFNDKKEANQMRLENLIETLNDALANINTETDFFNNMEMWNKPYQKLKKYYSLNEIKDIQLPNFNIKYRNNTYSGTVENFRQLMIDLTS